MTPEFVPLSRFDVRTVSVDGWRAVVSLGGELDVAAAEAITTELDGHLHAGRRAIWLDTQQIIFTDCGALSALVSANQRCRAVQIALILTHVSTPLRRLLTLTGLDQHFLIDTPDSGAST